MTDSMPRNSARHSNQNTINNRDTFLVVLACYLCYKGRGARFSAKPGNNAIFLVLIHRKTFEETATSAPHI